MPLNKETKPISLCFFKSDLLFSLIYKSFFLYELFSLFIDLRIFLYELDQLTLCNVSQMTLLGLIFTKCNVSPVCMPSHNLNFMSCLVFSLIYQSFFLFEIFCLFINRWVFVSLRAIWSFHWSMSFCFSMSYLVFPLIDESFFLYKLFSLFIDRWVFLSL